MSLKSSESQPKLNYDPADTRPITSKIKSYGREHGLKSQRFEAFKK